MQFECARVLHDTLLVPVLMYGMETMIWKEKERSSIRTIQMNKMRCLLDIRSMDRVPNERMRELCGMAKGVDERSKEVVLRWFSNAERM